MAQKRLQNSAVDWNIIYQIYHFYFLDYKISAKIVNFVYIVDFFPLSVQKLLFFTFWNSRILKENHKKSQKS